jgi:hypothetical protein
MFTVDAGRLATGAVSLNFSFTTIMFDRSLPHATQVGLCGLHLGVTLAREALQQLLAAQRSRRH